MHTGHSHRTALDLLCPPRCAACLAPAWADPRSELCSTCQAALPLGVPRCGICARPRGPWSGAPWGGGPLGPSLGGPSVGGLVGGPPGCRRCTGADATPDAFARRDPHSRRSALAGAVAGAPFDGVWRDLVLALKFARRVRAAAPLARCLAEAVWTSGVPGELVVPIPLARRRQLQRGFNQAELLARPLARQVDRRVLTHALRRIRGSAPLARTAHSLRAAAVHGAFVARADIVTGRTVLLVDDVLTTGATARAAARALRAAGARTVHIAVACRAGQSPG